MKRFFDLFLGIIILIIISMPMIFIAIVIKLSSKGPVLYWSERVGANNINFKMPKFRSMNVNTPIVATHLLENPSQFVSPIGKFIRKTSLDELPQIFSVLEGKMSLIGPRPALFNQYDLIELRNKNGLEKLIPGITGWAQVNGRDNLTNFEKVMLDLEYFNNKSLILDFKILWMTVLKVAAAKEVKH